MDEPIAPDGVHPVFLTEYERGMRAAILGVVLGAVLVLLGRRR
jgi:hypothetical protein